MILGICFDALGLQSSPSQSYYAVFDGHGGPEAAMYAASQLHANMVHDAHFHTDPELALKRAYSVTDQQFLSKAKTQVQSRLVLFLLKIPSHELNVE